MGCGWRSDCGELWLWICISVLYTYPQYINHNETKGWNKPPEDNENERKQMISCKMWTTSKMPYTHTLTKPEIIWRIHQLIWKFMHCSVTFRKYISLYRCCTIMDTSCFSFSSSKLVVKGSTNAKFCTGEDHYPSQHHCSKTSDY